MHLLTSCELAGVSYSVLFLSDLFHTAPTFLEISSGCRRFWRSTQQFPYESEAGKKTLPNQEPAYEHVKFRLEYNRSCQFIYFSKPNCAILRFTCSPSETNKINTNKKAMIENTVRTNSCIFHKYTVMTVKRASCKLHATKRIFGKCKRNNVIRTVANSVYNLRHVAEIRGKGLKDNLIFMNATHPKVIFLVFIN